MFVDFWCRYLRETNGYSLKQIACAWGIYSWRVSGAVSACGLVDNTLNPATEQRALEGEHVKLENKNVVVRVMAVVEAERCASALPLKMPMLWYPIVFDSLALSNSNNLH